MERNNETIMKKYTMSDARMQVDISKADWGKRIKVLTLKQSGMSLNEIARQLGITKQAVSQIYKRMGVMSVAEAEAIASSLE
jgi:DNA-binding NarL/FixJ family response regulator